jgi:DNA polymerase-3 subunit alpha
VLGGGEDSIDAACLARAGKLLQENPRWLFLQRPPLHLLSGRKCPVCQNSSTAWSPRDPVMLAGHRCLAAHPDDAARQDDDPAARRRDAQVEVVIFNELYEQNRHLLKDDTLLVIEGKVNRDDYSGGLRVTAEKIYDLAGARTRFAQGLRLACNGQSNGRKLAELLAPYQVQEGGCPVWVDYHNPNARCRVRLGADWRVRLDDRLIESLGDWLKPEAVNVVY